MTLKFDYIKKEIYMTTDEFIEKYRNAKEELSEADIIDTIKFYNLKNGIPDIKFLTIEYLSELIKYLMLDSRHVEYNRFEMIQKIADSYLGLRILTTIYNLDKYEIDKGVNVSLDKLKEITDNFDDSIYFY